MTELRRPDARLATSWARALADFGDEHPAGSGVWLLPPALRRDLTPAGCHAWVEALTPYADRSVALGEGPHGPLVHSTFWWIVDTADGVEEVVGFLDLRHELTPYLLETGGHVGYSVRPARRREGHASRALALAVGEAGELGLDRVLVTCDVDNVASARTIERCGGVCEDVRGDKRRYWVAVP